MSKNYATSSSLNSVCVFRKDYSFCVNGSCLGCKFCYKDLTPKPPVKYRTAGLLDIELDYNDSALKVPLTVSRYCDPFYNESAIKNSLYVMEKILRNNGQIILRTAISNIPDEAIDLIKEFPTNVQFQMRVFTGDTAVGIQLREDLAPGFSSFRAIFEKGLQLADLGVDTTLFVDPLILGVNNSDLFYFIKAVSKTKINKIVIKQLFSTPNFKNYLQGFVPRYASLLDKKVGEYYTYDTLELSKSLLPLFEHADSKNVNISVCSNKSLAILLETSENCCLFDNANAIYKSKSNTKHHKIINLKENCNESNLEEQCPETAKRLDN